MVSSICGALVRRRKSSFSFHIGGMLLNIFGPILTFTRCALIVCLALLRVALCLRVVLSSPTLCEVLW